MSNKKSSANGLLKRKPQKQPKSRNRNLHGCKFVGSYGNHLSLFFCDHYGPSILNKSNPTKLNRVDKVATSHCRSRTFNVRSHLQMDLAAQEHQLVSVTLWKLRKLSDSLPVEFYLFQLFNSRKIKLRHLGWSLIKRVGKGLGGFNKNQRRVKGERVR